MSSHSIEEHRGYVFDAARVDAFERALARCIAPGAVVVDLGSGTGLFSALACRLGAARVYAIDETPMLELARAICRDNGCADRVVFLRESSTRATLPERVDVVVGDQLAPFGFGAGFPFVYQDARDRFLKPDGTLLPGRVDLFVAPIELPDWYATVEAWAQRPARLDYSAAHAWARGTPSFRAIPARAPLSEGARGASIDLTRGSTDAIALDATCNVVRDGTMHGVGGWFVAELLPGITVSSSPTDSSRIERANVLFALDQPLKVSAGDRVRVSMVARPRDPIVGWSIVVEGADGQAKARTKHSSLESLLLSPEDVVRTKPTFAPARSPVAEAKLAVLTMMDGRRTVAEIEREILRAHPALFASPSQAAALVAEVVRDAAR